MRELAQFLAFLIPLASGFALAIALMPPRKASWAGLFLRLGLAPGLGFGASSIAFYAACRAMHPSATAAWLVHAGILAISVTAALQRTRNAQTWDLSPVAECFRKPNMLRALAILLGGLLASSLLADAIMHSKSPHGGGYDSFISWNMRARWIFRGGEIWQNGFSQLLAQTHPDYPLLIPCSVAQLWFISGAEAQLISSLVANSFKYGALCLLVSGLSTLRTPLTGFLAGIFLLGIPFFLSHGASQFADVPAGYFLLAAVILACKARDDERPCRMLPALAGVFIGLSAWTKNEGLLFVIAFFLSHAALTKWRGGDKGDLGKLASMFLGTAIALVAVVHFKLTLVPPNDLLAGQDHDSWKQLLAPDRHARILSSFGGGIAWFGSAPVMPISILGAYFLLLRPTDKTLASPSFRFVALLLTTILCGFYLVYLLTPHDLQWHLDNSFGRLICQIWPTFVMLFFGVTAEPRESVDLPVPTAAPTVQKGVE